MDYATYHLLGEPETTIDFWGATHGTKQVKLIILSFRDLCINPVPSSGTVIPIRILLMLKTWKIDTIYNWNIYAPEV